MLKICVQLQVGEKGVVAALTENGGMRANLAVEKLLALTVAADGPTRKWQAVNVVMELVKMGAIAGTVAESSMAQIVAAWNRSCEAGSEGHAELLQAALLDLLTQLAGLSPEVSASVEGAACHMIRCGLLRSLGDTTLLHYSAYAQIGLSNPGGYVALWL